MDQGVHNFVISKMGRNDGPIREETKVSHCASTRISLGLVTAAILLASTAHDARAAAFQLKEDSAVNLGTAFAGSASAAQRPSTVFDNPAGLTQLEGLQIEGGGSLIAPSFVFHGTSNNAFGRPNSGVDGRDGGNQAPVPYGYISYKVTNDLAVGLGLTSPFGLATTYGTNFIGRYQADKTELKTLNINPSLAYQVLSWLSLGAGFSAQYGRAEFSSVLNSSTIGTQALRRPVVLPDGYFRLRGDDWAFGYNFGALIQPGKATNIGLAYRSRVEQNFTGTADFVMPAPLSLNSAFRSSGGNAKLTLPDTATISITQGIGDKLKVSAEVSWTNWSQFKTLNAFRTDGTQLNSTPQHYHNTVFASLGASYKVLDSLTLRAGTAFDKTPVSNAYRTVRVPDADRVWLAGGVSYEVLPGTAIDFAYAHLFVKDSRINEVSTTGDLLQGRFTNSVDIVSVGTRVKF